MPSRSWSWRPAGGSAVARKCRPQIVHAVIGGLRKVLHTRLYRGEERELEEAAPKLWEWALSYYPPPQPLRARRRAVEAPSPFEGYTPVERIARAVTEVTAQKGYQAMSTDDIAERASISLTHLLLALRR